MPEIYVDADACPVKDEVYRVAERYGAKVYLVTNGSVRAPLLPWIERMIVGEGMDAADDWIAANIKPGDIAITTDIPLAARCLKAGAQALAPNGRAFTEDSIGSALASRELMSQLRDMGIARGGPQPFSKRDRSEFLQALDKAVQQTLRLQPPPS
ncbi:MAG: YaiI/YqxD family protein [Proteobacteria bacterium]|nr:YaiI/YqxD family protein [Pseudomonadota bacterium]MBI3507978.1 YaiI/YqxD family protein [Pseudomonadota bacterium]